MDVDLESIPEEEPEDGELKAEPEGEPVEPENKLEEEPMYIPLYEYWIDPKFVPEDDFFEESTKEERD